VDESAREERHNAVARCDVIRWDSIRAHGVRQLCNRLRQAKEIHSVRQYSTDLSRDLANQHRASGVTFTAYTVREWKRSERGRH
jgi:hypothetical protein